MIIRKPTLEESGILAQYNRDAAIEAGNQPLDTEKSEKGVLAVIEDESKGFYLVGEIHGQIVSMLLITYKWNDWRNGNWFLV
jgi:hypothetical protein